MKVSNKTFRRIGPYILIAFGLGAILIGGIFYVSSLRDNLVNQAVQNVTTVTIQQQQALDNFIEGDRERLHSFAKYFAQNDFETPEEIRKQLMIFSEVDAVYSVINLDQGWFCSSSSSDIREITEERLNNNYRKLEGSGVRDSYIGIVSNEPKFGYYESFILANGDKGLIQKSYSRSRVIDTFSLSFYNDQGLAYVITKEEGNILLHSNGQMGDHVYTNIFEALDVGQDDPTVIAFVEAMERGKAGNMVLSGGIRNLVYTYVPITSVDDWYLVSIVPEAVILSEADRILMNSKITFGILLAVLVIGGITIFLFWRNNREVRKKDWTIDYQEQLFDIFSTYLSKNTNDVYLMLDRTNVNHVEYVSPNLERVLGLSLLEALKEFEKWKLTDLEGKTVSLKDLSNMESDTAIEGVEIQWKNRRTGEQMWFFVSIYCTLMQEKPKLVVYISNRTREHRSREGLSEALKIAQSANDAKSAFLSSVSHDIRTPMNAIIGFASLLRGEAENPSQVREYTRRIETASKHLLELINDVLDLNKIESGGTMLNLSDMVLSEIIDEVNTVIRPQANAKDQTFEIYTSGLTHEHLMGDKLRINQILINLLSNAVKYTPKGGHIQMCVEELSQVMADYCRLCFTVQDNGMGMSEAYQKIIFEPFTREENDAIHQIQGSGFGMAITKSLVDLMGGTIHVSSQINKGSVFTVELELLIQEQEADPRFWVKHEVSKMIVADDDEVVCRNVITVMEGSGVVVDYVTDGLEVIKTIRRARENGEPYDLILLDWKMPGLNGLETARLIREKYPEKIPILFFTAYDWGEIEQDVKEIGVSHFLPKPFFISTFKEAIRKIRNSGRTKAAENGMRIAEGKRILIVDDIEVNRIILLKILGTMGAECDMAANGQEAVEKFLHSAPNTYDAILMDIQMPMMDGYQATHAIRDSLSPVAKTVPIIAMTANAFVEDVRNAINAGMDAHVAKPIQMDKLNAALQEVFDKGNKGQKQAEESQND